MTGDKIANAKSVQMLFQSFRVLNYWDRLNYYDCHFGLIPFLFPEADVRISWFSDEDKLVQLTDNFYKEIRNHHLLETSFEEGEKWYKFDVKPSSLVQRVQYNQFLLSKFAVTDEFIKNSIAAELERTTDTISFLQARIHAVQSTIAWIKDILYNKQVKLTLKHQFLQIVYVGVKNYRTVHNPPHLRNRRKFVEAYLFSQGIYVAAYMHWLQHFLNEREME